MRTTGSKNSKRASSKKDARSPSSESKFVAKKVTRSDSRDKRSTSRPSQDRNRSMTEDNDRNSPNTERSQDDDRKKSV